MRLLTKCTLALCLLFTTAVSQAADSVGGGDSSVIFTIWAPYGTGQSNSVSIDLGINLSDVLDPSGFTQSFDLDAQIAANTSYATLEDLVNDIGINTLSATPAQWNIAAGDNDTSGQQQLGRSILTSVGDDFSFAQISGTNNNVNAALSQIDAHINAHNQTQMGGVFIPNQDASAGGNGGSGNWGDNFGSGVGWADGDFDNSSSPTTDSLVTDTVGTVVPIDIFGSETVDLALLETANSDTDGLASLAKTLLGSITLDWDGAATTLSFDVAPIPVPAAVWLFGSALLGMVGFSRRKQQQAIAA